MSLDEDEVRERVLQLRDVGVEAVSVCLLHSYVNPAHEQRIKEILLEELPGYIPVRLPRGAAALPRVRALLDGVPERLRRPQGREIRVPIRPGLREEGFQREIR